MAGQGRCLYHRDHGGSNILQPRSDGVAISWVGAIDTLRVQREGLLESLDCIYSQQCSSRPRSPNGFAIAFDARAITRQRCLVMLNVLGTFLLHGVCHILLFLGFSGECSRKIQRSCLTDNCMASLLVCRRRVKMTALETTALRRHSVPWPAETAALMGA